MIKNGTGGNHTMTGAAYEERVSMKMNGIDLTKYKLYSYLKTKNIDYTALISKKLLPDEAYFIPETKTLIIYEKKFQSTPGSVDEKPQTCSFKIHQFRKIGAAIGATTVKYIYIFNDWFRKPEYKDMLDYIKSVNGCDYMFVE